LNKNVVNENCIYDDKDQTKNNATHEENSEEESSNVNNIKINDTI
jgi:hypothetical protein